MYTESLESFSSPTLSNMSEDDKKLRELETHKYIKLWLRNLLLACCSQPCLETNWLPDISYAPSHLCWCHAEHQLLLQSMALTMSAGHVSCQVREEVKMDDQPGKRLRTCCDLKLSSGVMISRKMHVCMCNHVYIICKYTSGRAYSVLMRQKQPQENFPEQRDKSCSSVWALCNFSLFIYIIFVYRERERVLWIST